MLVDFTYNSILFNVIIRFQERLFYSLVAFCLKYWQISNCQIFVSRQTINTCEQKLLNSARRENIAGHSRKRIPLGESDVSKHYNYYYYSSFCPYSPYQLYKICNVRVFNMSNKKCHSFPSEVVPSIVLQASLMNKQIFKLACHRRGKTKLR